MGSRSAARKTGDRRAGSERTEARRATFVLIHGSGDVGWPWHLVQPELTALGHDSIAPDLPCDDDSATLIDYASTVIEAVGDRSNQVVAGIPTAHSPHRSSPSGSEPTRWSCSPV